MQTTSIYIEAVPDCTSPSRCYLIIR